MKKFSFFFFLILLSSLVSGQAPPYIHFRGGEDIPSSETYHVIQDRQGYIWIATANGVSRFDGYEFKNFSIKDGLPDEVIFEIYEDYKGRIWFVSQSGMLAYYFGGKIYPYKYNYVMAKMYKGARGAIKLSFRVGKDDAVSVSVKDRGAFEISTDGHVVMLNTKVKKKIFVDFSDGNSNGIITIDPIKIFNGEEFFFGNNRSVDNNKYQLYFLSNLFAVKDDSFNVVFTVDFRLISYWKGIFSSDSTSNQVIWISVDQQGRCWVSKYNGGVECYRNLDLSQKPIYRLFDGLSITSVLEDRDGGFWFSTYSNGVFYISNIDSRVYFWKSDINSFGHIASICCDKAGIWVGFDSKHLFCIPTDGAPRTISTSFLFRSDVSINKLLTNSANGQLWLLSNVFLYSYNDGKFVRHPDKQAHVGIPSGFAARSVAFEGDSLWIGNKFGLLESDGHQETYNSYQSGEFTDYINSITIAKDGTKWLGCLDGLWRYNNGSYEWLGLSNPRLRSRIGELAFNPVDSSLWIATHGNGLIVYNKGQTAVINQSLGLASDVVNSIAMGNDRVWVGTSQGINQVSIVPDISGQYSVSGFDRSVGIVSNEIVGLQATDSSLVIGTREGLMVYPLKKDVKNVRPPVYITNFAVNGIDTTITNGLRFSYLENQISLMFASPTFKTLRKTLFRYKIRNEDTTFSYTRIPQVTLPALSPGKYNFQVWAQNAFGQWSENPATLYFTINPPFWRTPLFVFIVAIFIIVSVSSIFAVRNRSFRLQTDLSRRLDGWKQQALLQQMNPHFIFNTLNSIQLFILQNDTLTSHRYLSKFAKLMRLTLDNSQNFSVRLGDELETIRLYLELEALRADGKFTFEISQPNDLLLESQIPSLIIQPFVENAIWHGVLPKESEGKILLKTLQKEESIVCIIEDNGIGRKAAESYAATRVHKSLGSKITMQRLQLLRSMHSQQLGIIYTDLVDEDGTPAGTRVELTIPILSKKIQLD